MRLSLFSYRKNSATRKTGGDLNPKPTKATATDDARPQLGVVYLHKDKDGYWLLATDGYIMAKVPVKADLESDDMPVEGPIPANAMKHIERMPNKGLKAVWSFFTARSNEVQVGEDTTYKRREVSMQPPKFLDVLKDAREIKKPLKIGFDSVLLKNLADALGTEQLEVTIDLDALDTPERGAEVPVHFYTKALVVEPNGQKDGRIGLQMPVKLDVR